MTTGQDGAALRIKVMPDYQCWPLWWDSGAPDIGNIDPASLGLPAPLVADLTAWAERFEAGFDWDDPGRSPAPTSEEALAFEAEGRSLARRVAAALGPGAVVRYWKDQPRSGVASP